VRSWPLTMTPSPRSRIICKVKATARSPLYGRLPRPLLGV
jgi:hypothetical protein